VLDAVATLRRLAPMRKGIAKGKFRNLQKVQFSTFPHAIDSVWRRCGNDPSGAGDRGLCGVAGVWRNRHAIGTIASHTRDSFSATLKAGGQGRRPRGENQQSMDASGGLGVSVAVNLT